MNDQLKETITAFIKHKYREELKIELQTPPEKSFGDKATNIAMILARTQKRNPLEIAEEIKSELFKESYISKVEVVKPGFINIFFNDKDYVLNALKEINKPDFLSSQKGEGEKLIIEHTASNPNKHLHIGHLRNFCIGDSLRGLFSKTKYDVEIQWFNNDQGLQIAKVLWGLKNLDILEIDENHDLKFDTYCSKVYAASEKYITTHPEVEEEVRQIIQSMEAGNNATSIFAEETTQRIIKGQLQTIENFNVLYNAIISESSLTQSGVLKNVLDNLLELNKIEIEAEGKNTGCLVIKNLKDEKGNSMPDKVLLRSDGTAVYTAKDIALHIWKYGLMKVEIPFVKFYQQRNKEWIYTSSIEKKEDYPKLGYANYHINVVDIRQAFPLEVVRQALKTLGYMEAAKNYFHLGYEVVTLSKNTAQRIGIDTSDGKASYAMSGRKGFEISIDHLLHEMTNEVSHKKPELSKEESCKIASGALRYYMLKFGYNSIINFDIDEALKSDGDTGIYLQYTFVRAIAILNKSEDSQIEEFNINELNEYEKDLVLKLYDAKHNYLKSVEDLDIQRICVYTFELCKQFSTFYQNVNVLNETNEGNRKFRLYLMKSFLKTLGEVMDIIGIYKPLKM